MPALAVHVTGPRNADPLGLTPRQRYASDREQLMRQGFGFPAPGPLTRWQRAVIDAALGIAP